MCVHLEGELLQSGVMSEIIQLLQWKRWDCGLKHTNHFNLKPIPSRLTSMHYTDVLALPFITFAAAALS